MKVHDIGLCNDYGMSIRDHYAITATMKHVMHKYLKKLVSYRK